MGNAPQMGSWHTADLHHKLTLTGSVDKVKQKNGADETEPSADPNLHHLNPLSRVTELCE